MHLYKKGGYIVMNDDNLLNETQQENDNHQYQQYNSYQTAQPQMVQPNYENSGLEEPVSMGEWLVALLISMIPCVNVIMFFVWAFGNDCKKSKSNFFKARLIMIIVHIVVYTLLYAVVFVSFASYFYKMMGI